MMPTCLDDALENWQAMAPGMWENDVGPEDWWAVSNDKEGIVAYFQHERDAFRWRLGQINRQLNG